MQIKSNDSASNFSICVVIPAFKVSKHIVHVVESIGPEVQKIIVIDDACPDSSGNVLVQITSDPRLEVIYHKTNMGVGGAVKTGYRRALEIGYDLVIKIDGDGQMDASKIKEFVAPLIANQADYTKGNRFFGIEAIRQMPKVRIVGNLVLTFMKTTKKTLHIYRRHVKKYNIPTSCAKYVRFLKLLINKYNHQNGMIQNKINEFSIHINHNKQ